MSFLRDTFRLAVWAWRVWITLMVVFGVPIALVLLIATIARAL